MVRKIDQDRNRFRAIVRGKIRQNLRKFITRGELLGRAGKKRISIPLPQIQIPRFTFGSNRGGGVGQGDGESGTPVKGDGAGPSDAGEMPGDHILEVDVTLEEL
ncbi:MAG: DUF444 family protein, partial [Planctomycetota bacterium]